MTWIKTVRMEEDESVKKAIEEEREAQDRKNLGYSANGEMVFRHVGSCGRGGSASRAQRAGSRDRGRIDSIQT